MKKKAFGLSAWILSLVFVSAVLSSCSVRNKTEGYIYFRIPSNPTTLDPALIVDVTGGIVAAKIFNGLVRLDESLNVIPDIAQKWAVRDGGVTYLFYLRKGVLFSNGREVTAADFKYSFERIISSGNRSPNAWVFERISGSKEFASGKSKGVRGVEVIDDHTLKITLEKPFSSFLSQLTTTAAYVVPREETERRGADFSSHPVGTGPYVLKKWSHNGELVLIGNPAYFGARTKGGGIVYRIIPEDLTAVTEFELGNLDVLTVPSSEYSRYKNSAQWKEHLSSVRGLNTYYLGFNCSRPPFDRVSLRRAVGYAVDRKTILATFYQGRGRLARGPVPDLLRGWREPPALKFDPAEAKRIIEKEGLKGLTVNFFITDDQEVSDIAAIIQYYLKRVGLHVRIKQLEWSAYKSAINRGEADMFWISWWADYPDAENFLFPLFHSSNFGTGGNRTRYANQEVDRLISAGRGAVSLSEKGREYGKAEEIIEDECPCIFFWHKTDFTLRQSWIRNYGLHPIYTMDKGLDISL